MSQHRRHFFILLVGCFALALYSATGYAQVPLTPEQMKIAQLFDKWNTDLQTGKPEVLVKNYAPNAILLPTVSKIVRHNPKEMKDYFKHFMEDEPSGKIDQNEQNIRIYGDIAINSGNYTFTFKKTGKVVPARYTFVYHRNTKGEWWIVEHHSSEQPKKD